MYKRHLSSKAILGNVGNQSLKSEVEVGEAGLGELAKKRQCHHKMTPEMHEHQIMKIGLNIHPKGGLVL